MKTTIALRIIHQAWFSVNSTYASGLTERILLRRVQKNRITDEVVFYAPITGIYIADHVVSGRVDDRAARDLEQPTQSN